MIELGIDISKLTFDAGLLVNGRIRTKKFKNAPQGFEALLEWISPHGIENIHACMEGTGKLWEMLADFLYDKGLLVSVVNPFKIKGFADGELRRHKTDKEDARLIARFCHAMNPRPWTPPSSTVRAIRDMHRYVSELKANRTQETNRLSNGPVNAFVETQIRKHIEFIDAQICNVEREIRCLVKANHELSSNMRLLQSIIGVGEVTALTFLTELPSVDQFNNARAIENFCGVAPRMVQSGTSVHGRSQMSKRGNNRMRSGLFLPALTAMTRNPVFIEVADRLKKAGKPGKVIIGAIMRKLLRLMFAVLKSGKPFDVNHKSMLQHPMHC